MPKVLYLKGFWTFRVCADVSHCFHSASTEADLTTGVANLAARTAVSPKNGERFTENSERFSENGERFILATAISLLATADTTRRTANTAMRQLFSPKSPTTFGKAVRLSEKWYDFFTATAVSYSGTANTATATAIPRAGTAISRTYLMRERLVKRSWNVGNAPAHPRPLYLLGF